MFAFAIHALVKHAFENYCETVHRRTHEEIQSLWTGSIECSRVLLLSYINNRCLYMLASSRVSFRYRRCLCNVNIILILNIFPDSVGTSHFAISLFSSRWTLIHITTETVISREIIVSCFFGEFTCSWHAWNSEFKNSLKRKEMRHIDPYTEYEV